MNEDYSHDEISKICHDLIGECSDRLKSEEIDFVKKMYSTNLDEQILSSQRDSLIGMYDRMIGG